MKKTVIFIMTIVCICLYSVYPALLWATTRTVSLTWTMPETTNVQGYKVYYDSNSNMNNKIWLNSCSTPIENPTNTFSITCNDVEIEDNQVYYFIITALLADSTESYSNPYEAKVSTTPVTISSVQNFQIATAVEPNNIDLAINFQPGDAPRADGFTEDNGLVFDATRGYGWNAYMPNSRDRNNPISPDQSYDTNIIYISSSNTWEINIPNGAYIITVCAGDPSHPSGLQSIQVEGISVLHENISNDLKWIEHTISTTVSDGRLTLTFQDSNDTKLCWVKITSQ